MMRLGRASEATTRRRADIQGLRALAVGAVVLNHAHLAIARGGFVGVDIFFVISGFLITSQLVRSLVSKGRISLLDFYSRRIRRILPASLVVAVLTVAAAWALVPPLQLRQGLNGAAATVLYVPNILFAVQGTNYLLQTTTPSLFLHYWSLGVEEQFYLLWPALLGVTFVIGRRSVRALTLAMAVLATASLAACGWLTRVSQPWAFFSLPTRAWEFAAGGLAAIAVVRVRYDVPRWIAGAVGWAGLLGLGVAVLVFTDAMVFPGWAAALPVGATVLVILGGTWGGRTSPGVLLGLSPLVFLGEISYSLYLVHWPVLAIADANLSVGSHRPPQAVMLGLAIASIGAAYVLYRLVERPFRDSSWALRLPPRRVMLGAAAASLVIALGATSASAWVSGRPLATPAAASAYIARSYPLSARFVPANMTPSLTSIEQARAGDSSTCADLDGRRDIWRCDFGANPQAPLVVMFGDSHADQFRFALEGPANDGQIYLESYMMSGCPAASVSTTRYGNPYAECDAWRAAAIDELRQRGPAAVLLGSFQGDHDVTDAAGWRQGYAQTIAEFSEFTQVVLLVDTPSPGFDVPTCVSAHLYDPEACSVTVDATFRSMEHSIASGLDVPAVDVIDYLCRASTCPAVIDNMLVYRDGSHISAEMSRSLTPLVWPMVQGQLTVP